MALFIPPNVRATDSNANPLSSATWSFYLTGTLTPATVYSNPGLTTPLGAVVTSDAGGAFVNIFLNPDIIYRAILRKSDGTTIVEDADPYDRAVSQADIASQIADLATADDVSSAIATEASVRNAADTAIGVQITTLQSAVSKGRLGYATWALLHAAFPAYDNSHAYAVGDTIRDQSAFWVAIASTTGHVTPTLPTTLNSYWQLITSSPSTFIAEVPTTDTATHTDPVTSGTVNNTGVFKFDLSTNDWTRLYDVDSVAATTAATAAAASAAQAAALFADSTFLGEESDAFGLDFNQTAAYRMISNTAGVTTFSSPLALIIDEYATTAFPTRTLNSDGTRSYTVHNLYPTNTTSSSAATRNVTTIVGHTYTVYSVTGTFVLTGAASATTVAATAYTFTASTTNLQMVNAGTATYVQVCFGSVVTAYVVGGSGAINVMPPVSWHPVQHKYALMIEPGRTNFFLASTVPATQTISLVAGTYTVWCEAATDAAGTITLSGGPTGTATAGTSLAPRTGITFTLGSTTSVVFTKSGTLTHVQVEQGSYATSPILTFTVSVARLVSAPKFPVASMPAALNSAYAAGSPLTWYFDYTHTGNGVSEHVFSVGTNAATDLTALSMNVNNPTVYVRRLSDTLTQYTPYSETVLVSGSPVTVAHTVAAGTRSQITINGQASQHYSSFNGIQTGINNTLIRPLTSPGSYIYFGTLIASNFLTGPVYIFRVGVVLGSTPPYEICSRLNDVTVVSEDPVSALVIIGQSNGAGNASGGSGTTTDAGGNFVLQFSQNAVVSAATQPLLNPIPVSGASPDYVGVAVPLARDKAASGPNSAVYILPEAVGNSGFGGGSSKWGVGFDCHNNALSAMDSFRARFPNVQFLAVIALRSEYDATTAGLTQNAYAAYTDAEILDYRAGFGNQLPFVLGIAQPGYIASNSAAFAPINAAIRDTPNRLSYVGVADTVAYPIAANPSDPPHFNLSQVRSDYRDCIWSAFKAITH